MALVYIASCSFSFPDGKHTIFLDSKGVSTKKYLRFHGRHAVHILNGCAFLDQIVFFCAATALMQYVLVSLCPSLAGGSHCH
jgi:hypothetical protein